jgi:hypothetical protein
MALRSERSDSRPVSAVEPPLAADPWTAAMLRGDFARAWKICDDVLAERVRNNTQCWHWPRHEQFLWRGESLNNKRVLVHCYHGLGDTLQFARLLTPLSKIAAEVAVWVQPPLLDAVAGIEGVRTVHPLHDGAPEMECDVDIELMELLHALRIDISSLPCSVPYIDVGTVRKRNNSTRLHVGLVWRSGDWDERRSLQISHVSTLMNATSHIEWSSFQFGASRSLPRSLQDLSCRNVDEMGRRLQRMDLLISVDTMAAHLAGALGLPVWTLLPHACDWRWLLERSDSPWYPSMRLFRQGRTGKWDEVIQRVSRALRALMTVDG